MTYLDDIVAQPGALSELIRQGPDPGAVDVLTRRLHSVDRIVLTGMGASHFALYPTYLRLVQLGLPAWWVETSELLHHQDRLVTDTTLVWIASQSGRSIEAKVMAEALHTQGAPILATTNDPESPLAARAEAVIPLRMDAEDAVSTRSYVNTLAANDMTLNAALDVDESGDTPAVVEAVSSYLAELQAHLDQMRDVVGVPTRLFVVGRGVSLAAAWTGALVIKEAAKVPVEGTNAAQFRHGPLELADARLTVLLLPGGDATRPRMRRLAEDLCGYGAQAIWLGADAPSAAQSLAAPAGQGIAQAIAEIVPLQLLSVSLAQLTGVDPGVFRHLGKVTLVD